MSEIERVIARDAGFIILDKTQRIEGDESR